MAGEDDYERSYMNEGPVLYRHKARPSPAFFLMIAATLLVPVAIIAVAMQAPNAPWFTPFFVLPTWLVVIPLMVLFSVLRVAVTSDHLHIQYGLFGPRIPISAIASCEAVSYDWKKYGGWGIRRGLDGSTAYNLMGDGGRAVRLAWTDESGQPQVTLISAKDPDALVAAVAQARAAARPRVGRGPRSSTDDRAVAEAERELDAELEAQADAERGRERTEGRAKR